MRISKIYSTRKSNIEVYSDLIYEWEDDFSKDLKIPIYSYSRNNERLIRFIFRILHKYRVDTFFQKIESLRKRDSKILVFELYPRSYFSYQVFSNKIPYIIDFDFNVKLDVFYSVYKNCKLILISSLVAYNYLKSQECPLNIVHLPLSISDRYKIDLKANINKEFDVIVARANKVFVEYLELFSNDNPNFEYVIRRWEGNQLYKNNVYYSNKRGILGEFSDRISYFNLLKKAKVALYATPGFDESSERFMNHVTPSLFEFISSGCHIIARYPSNAETDFFNLNKISPSVDSYEKFKDLLFSYMNDTSSDYLEESADFLQNVYTSKQALRMNLIINSVI